MGFCNISGQSVPDGGCHWYWLCLHGKNRSYSVQAEMFRLAIPTFMSGIKYLTLVEKKLQTVLVLKRYCKF